MTSIIGAAIHGATPTIRTVILYHGCPATRIAHRLAERFPSAQEAQCLTLGGNICSLGDTLEHTQYMAGADDRPALSQPCDARHLTLPEVSALLRDTHSEAAFYHNGQQWMVLTPDPLGGVAEWKAVL